MIVSTSERGEPAKISFCSVSTDSIENRPDSSFPGPPRDRPSAGDCTARSMNCPSLRYWIRLLDFPFQNGGNVDGVNEKLDDLLPFCREFEVGLLQADFISAYFIPSRPVL